MSQYYARRDRDRDNNSSNNDMDSATEYAKLYQRAQRAARNGSSFSPPASPTYEFARQRTWPGPNGSGGGSYEERERERGIPIRERDRDRDMMDRDRDWQPSSSPRTPRTAGMTSGSSIGGGSGGSYGRRERDLAESPRHGGHHDLRSSPQHRDRDRDRDRDRERDRDRDRDRQREREHREREKERERQAERELEREREEQERKRDRDVCRQRMRYATQGYARRLRAYLHPVLQNQQAMDHATDIFVKLDRDARYLTRSAGALLESLAAVADDQASGGNGTGLDDPPPATRSTDSEDFTTTEESSALEDSETAAESVSSDSDSDDDEQQQFGGYGSGGGGSGGGANGDMPNFSRRPSLVNGSVVGGSSGVGGGRRRSSAGQRNSGSGPDHQRKGSGGAGTGSAGTSSSSATSTSPALMRWAGFRPYALSKHPDSVNDRRKSYLVLTQIISVTLLASLGVDTDSNNNSSAGARGHNTRLSTRGLLAELLRVLQPKDYRAYFRAAARVILLPDTGVARKMPDEMALEALERQLLGTAKFVPGVMGSSGSSGSSTPSPMMACLTYTSGSHGTITLYRLDMAPPGSAAGGSSESWPRRITPVSAMTGVPKELLRRTARSMPPSRRTVLKVMPSSTTTEKEEESTSTSGGREKKEKGDKSGGSTSEKDKKGDKSKSGSNGSAGAGGGGGKSPRLRWISLPADTVAVPGLGFSPNVDQPALSSGFCDALAITPDDLLIAPGTTANIVNATLPAMFGWLHVRAAYLTGVEFEGTEVQRSSSGSTATNKSSPSKDRHRERDRDRDRDRDFDETASTSTSTTMPPRGRIKRIVRWKHGPAPIDHEGKDACIVVLHPSRGEWVTAPVYWTDAKG